MSNMSDLDEEILEAVTDTTTTTTADSCSAGSETLDKVLRVLGDMSEVTQLLMVGYWRITLFVLNDYPLST